MPRQNNRLSAISLTNKPPGFHADGRGLYLSVSVTGSRSWIFRYMLRGKSRDMGLGPSPSVSLSDARQMAEAARTLCRAGVDPIKHRDDARRAQMIEEAKSISFEKCEFSAAIRKALETARKLDLTAPVDLIRRFFRNSKIRRDHSRLGPAAVRNRAG
jgi:hypothetical protein